MLDTVHEVSTPELIELHLHCAGPTPRSLAWLVDLLLRLGLLAGLAIPLAMLKGTGAGVTLILYFALEWFYPVLFEVLGGGATPGKRMFGLLVVNSDGSPVGWGASFTRNLLRTADFLPALYGLGLLSMLMTKNSQRLGDIVAGTLVVYRRQETPLPALPDVAAWQPRHPVSRAAQRAVLAFAERAPRLSKERAEELASYAPQLTDGAQGQVAVTRLYGLAHALTGSKR